MRSGLNPNVTLCDDGLRSRSCFVIGIDANCRGAVFFKSITGTSYINPANLTNPVTDSVFSKMGTAAMDSLKANPFQAAGFGMNVYDRMNPSQAPLQPSPMLSAQQLMGQQGAVPTPQFNSIPQLPRRPIYIG